MKKLVGIGAAVAVAFLASAPFVSAAESAPAAGKVKADVPAVVKVEAPAAKPLIVFKVKDGSGADVTQDALKGKKTLLVFAQTACSQCRSEVEAINSKYDGLAGKGQIYIVLVDVAGDRALAFYKSQNYKMPVLLDPDFTIPPQVNVRVTPSTVLVDGDLKVIENTSGFKKSELEALLGKL